MDLMYYGRAVRTHWIIFLLGVLVCTAAAAALAWTRTEIYEAQSQFFVSPSGKPTDLSDTYQGGLFTEQRVQSYARIMSSPLLAQSVITQLGLSEGVQDIQDTIDASVPVDSVLINVKVRDESPAGPRRSQMRSPTSSPDCPHAGKTAVAARNRQSR